MEDRFEAKYPKDAWQEEITILVSLIKSGNSVQIMGIPGVGRSNLLGLLAYNRKTRILHLGKDQEKFHFVLMNFSEMRKKDEVEILKFYFISIMDSLKERSMEDEYEKAKQLFKDAIDIPDKQVFLQNLKKLIDFLSIDKNLSIIFLVDRFEDYLPFLTPEFFTDLRALRNRAKYKFSVVFSTIKPLEEIIEPETYKDFYEFLEGNSIYLPIKEEKSLNFRIKFLQEKSSKKLSSEALDELLEQTSGHGKLTRLSIEALMGEVETKNNISGFLLTQPKINKLFNDIWIELNPSEQKYLKNLNKDERPTFLEKAGLVVENKIAIPLFKNFVEKNSEILLSDLKEDIKINDAGEIVRGDIVLSDLLTSSEYKLLRFFIENEGKILSRDETIEGVWKDLSSTAGVSEQALDQLIFRLRKKIEENPNSPKHIQTVKGRGFKFTS